MSNIVYCNQCKSSGRSNRCCITGFDNKCGHIYSWAYERNKNGNNIIECNCGSCNGNKNKCFITGYDYKCGHDNGWAYQNDDGAATCYSCGKKLSGKWSMENNPSNNSYFNWTTGRYLGISDGYFLYGTNSNWVYSYCKPCWKVQIQNILPSLGIKTDNNELLSENSKLKQNNSQLQNEINNKQNEINNKQNEINNKQNEINNKQNEINNLKKQLEEKNEQIKIKDNKINELNSSNKNNTENLNSAPVNLDLNNQTIIAQSFAELELEKIKILLESSEIEEISDLYKNFSSKILSSKIMEEFNNICQSKIKEIINEIIVKINEKIEKIKNHINQISSIPEQIKENLSEKKIPENVTNFSIQPLEKYIDDLKKKIEKMEEIKKKLQN